MLTKQSMTKQSITKDTQLCMSLAARPGNFGTRLHNFLYKELDLNYIYKAFTTNDLEGAVRGIRALGIRGCAVSMPFKEACIGFLDRLDPSAGHIASVNTIVNDHGVLTGYNTDYLAVEKLLKQCAIPPTARFTLRGSGGMAKAIACALYRQGFRNGTIQARNQAAGKALAGAYGLGVSESASGESELLINATPIGMTGGPEAFELAFPRAMIASAQWVFDTVALPLQTPLITTARDFKRIVITGLDVTILQSIEQFVLYTSVRPGPELIARAQDYLFSQVDSSS